ncbi:MAG: SRPBCC domain-containing protein [Chloroflexota bacterium]
MTQEIEDISTDNTAVNLTTTFPHLTPQQLFDQFTQPEQLITWWPQEAVTHVVAGGQYELKWPAMNWTLRGQYTAVSPPNGLSFTWQWDHQPELPTRTVHLTINADGNGSRLEIEHGRYDQTEVDQADRQSHIDGWDHFLAVLHHVSALTFYKAQIERSQTAFLNFLNDTDQDILYQKKDAEGWTPATILAHISDGRTFYASEVARLANEQGGAFGRPLTDHHRLETIEQGNNRAVAELESSIQSSYTQITSALGNVQPAHLAFECEHPAYGRYTLGQIIGRFLVGHDKTHVNQIQDILNG